VHNPERQFGRKFQRPKEIQRVAQWVFGFFRQPVDRIAVAQQVAWELGERKGLTRLLSCPLRGRVGGNVEVQDTTPVMGQNQENVKNLKTDRGHGEEIDGDQLLGMILKECPPALRGRFVTSQHVFADTALSDVDAEFE